MADSGMTPFGENGAPWQLVALGPAEAVALAQEALQPLTHHGRTVVVTAVADGPELGRLLEQSGDVAAVLTDSHHAAVLPPLLVDRPEIRVLPLPALPEAALVALAAYDDLRRLKRRLADRERELTETRLILQRLETIDPLTGFVNRRRFLDIASREVLRSRRRGGGIAVIVLDIDPFEAIVGGHGHAAGDAVLLAVAGRVGMALRTLDVPGRLDGAEFAILLPDTPRDGARIVADRLGEAIAATPIAAGDGPLAVTASLGVAALDREETVDGLMQRADAALAAARRAGGNRVVLG